MDKLRILIAAQSPLFGRSLAGMMVGGNYEVIQSRGSDEVVDYLRGTSVDLCLMQDVLQGQSGLEICEQFAGSPIPVVIFSAARHVEGIALKKGAAGFLKMPCRSRTALALVRGLKARDVPGVEESAEDSAELPVPDLQAESEDQAGTPEEAPLILLVDDSQMIHSFVGGIIRDAGFRLAEAYHGVEGFEQTQKLGSVPIRHVEQNVILFKNWWKN